MVAKSLTSRRESASTAAGRGGKHAWWIGDQSSPGWLDLFEPSFRGYVCRAIEGNVNDLARGLGPSMADDIDHWVVGLVEDFLACHYTTDSRGSTDAGGAHDFLSCAEALRDKMRDNWPFELGDGATHAQRVAETWEKFAATSAVTVVAWAKRIASDVRWTEEEKEKLRALRKAGHSDERIGQIVGASRQRVSELIGSKQANKARLVTQSHRGNGA